MRLGALELSSGCALEALPSTPIGFKFWHLLLQYFSRFCLYNHVTAMN